VVGEEEPRKVVVDTYALLAMAYGELGADAARHRAPIISDRDFSLASF